MTEFRRQTTEYRKQMTENESQKKKERGSEVEKLGGCENRKTASLFLSLLTIRPFNDSTKPSDPNDLNDPNLLNQLTTRPINHLTNI